MFWQSKKKIGSDEYETVVNKLSTLRGQFTDLEQEVRGLRTDVNLLRGQFNRKLAGLAKEEKELATPAANPADEAKPLNKAEPKVFTGMNYYGNT